MLKSILFDFDGVIADSVDIKTNAFYELFKAYPQQIDRIIEYHKQNGGLSRFVKIRYIYEEFLKKPISDEELKRTGEHFSALVKEQVVKAPMIEGAQELLEAYYRVCKLFVVSGTPHEEMREIVAMRRLDKYFAQVYGSPTKKSQIISDIVKAYQYNLNEVIFIGDSLNDFEAAQTTGVRFIARVGPDKFEWLNDPSIEARVSNLKEFQRYLEQLSNQNEKVSH